MNFATIAIIATSKKEFLGRILSGRIIAGWHPAVCPPSKCTFNVDAQTLSAESSTTKTSSKA